MSAFASHQARLPMALSSQALQWRRIASPLVAAALLLCAAQSRNALADVNAQLNELLEANATAAAYAKMCDEEPMAEQLKSTTMLVLTTNDIAAENIQLGSGKFNDVMRRELARYKGATRPDCASKVKEARERLDFTRDILRNTRRDPR